jgi:hypothetical protein
MSLIIYIIGSENCQTRKTGPPEAEKGDREITEAWQKGQDEGETERKITQKTIYFFENVTNHITRIWYNIGAKGK